MTTTPETPAPAALLRRAADRLDELAEKATPGPWLVEFDFTGETPQALFVEGYDGTRGIGALDHSPDNVWAATLGPQVGSALAVWLRSAAVDAEEVGPDFRAVNVALALLGETEAPSGLAVYRDEEPCDCGPNAICADHLCPCGCGDPPLSRDAQEALDAYRHRVVEHDRAYIRRKIRGDT
ncbi:MAG: hypothetical protein L0I24_06985 [Pseudonocardia sp.]|nr:hypothetical protein [Pseudonocardia sp.]